MDSKTHNKDLRKACVEAVFDEFAEHGDMIRPQYAEQWDEIYLQGDKQPFVTSLPSQAGNGTRRTPSSSPVTPLVDLSRMARRGAWVRLPRPALGSREAF